jgi:serine/threonine-protein kinase
VATETRIGTEIAGYRIRALLGRGGMSTVYLAEHTTLGRTAALKLLATQLAELPGYRERFIRESRSVAAIDHPNIIPIYDAGEAEGSLYIAMRHVVGSDLSVELDGGPLPLGRVIYIIEQVASALDAAHARGLVHRDVKPANVIIAEHTDHVYLTDFGIAKSTTAAGGLTEAGAFLGTIDYAAPEQIERRPVDARTDVYALGCVLYTCLTGEPPYARDPEQAIMQAKLVQPPPKITSVRPELPTQLDDVFAKSLALSMDDRYASCGELAAAARAACLRTRSSSAPLPDQEPATQRRVPETVAAPIPPFAEPDGGRPTPTEPDQSPPPVHRSWRDRLRSPAGIALAAAIVALAAIAGYFAFRGGSSDGEVSGMEHDAITRDLLLAHVPEEMRESCQDVAVPDIDVFTRSVSCTRDSGETTRYSRAHNGNDLRRYFISRLTFVNLKYPTAGDCKSMPRASGEWERVDLLGHREARSKSAQGRVACWVEGDEATLMWTDTPTKILAATSTHTDDRDALYAWWTTAAGPGTNLSHERHPLEPFPDAMESELLLDHIPETIRDSCERAENPDMRIFLRSVSCDQPDGAGTVQYSYAHSGIALRQYFAGRVTAEGYSLDDPSGCEPEGTGVGPYVASGASKREGSRNTAGSLLCFKREGNATMEWFDVPQVVYASASRPEADAMELYHWWKTNAGPVDLGHDEEGEAGHDEEPGTDEPAGGTEMPDAGHEDGATSEEPTADMSDQDAGTDDHTGGSDMP